MEGGAAAGVRAARWERGGGGRYSAKLLGGDSAVTILVEKGEGLLELSNLLLSKLVCAPHNVGVASQRREEQI